MTDETHQSFFDRFISQLVAVIGDCVSQGDDAEVSVNGIPLATFKPAEPRDDEELEEEPQRDPYDPCVVDLNTFKSKIKH